jgi:ABC-type dipeptide/oligopeptide/nickel transport system ATPase subunit
VIAVEDLRVRFGRGKNAVEAVRGISFAVKERETFGLVGESGSGKSTVLRALCGLVRDFEGAIRVAGETQGSTRTAGFHRLVQMVFQDPFGSLHPRHTVDRILGEPIAIQRLGNAEVRIARALSEVGLGPAFRFRYPHQLSGGQRQRVAIARALVVEPKVLLLDEPTSALDVSVQAEILNLLLRLRRERALTTILVSHNLAVVGHLCDRLLVMNAGRAVEEMTAADLRSSAPRDEYTRALLLASEGYKRA